jgi:hypothetical protein
MRGVGTAATRARAKQESVIQWDTDTNKIIMRKLRAFCGQDIGIRLKARVQDTLYYVYDLETYTMRTKYTRAFQPGTLLGYYQSPGKYSNQPIIKTIDGAVVLLAEEANGRQESDVPFTQENILPPVKKKVVTKRKYVTRSIAEYQKMRDVDGHNGIYSELRRKT